MDYPKLITPILLTLFAALSLSIAYFEHGRFQDGWKWLEIVLVVMGLICLFFAVGTTIDWLVHKVTVRTEAYRRAMAITPLSEFAESLHGLTDKCADVVGAQRLSINIIPSTQLPIFRVILPQGDVLRSFAAEFLMAGTDEKQRAASYYNDGDKRQWANWIRDWTVAEGLAEPRGPNKPAAWKRNGRELALYAFGVETPEGEADEKG